MGTLRYGAAVPHALHAASMAPASLVIFALVLVSGCGVQLSAGAHARAPHAASLGLAGRLATTRTSGPYAGGELVLRLPGSGYVSPRHVLAGAGYRLLGSPFSLELGPELGAGEPAFSSWSGTGFYVGAASTLLLRVAGNQDSTLGYSVVSLLLDLVLVTRGGLWSRPAGDTRAELGDASISIGLRGSAISDVVVSANRNWSP
jgi:hypothetical protein